MVECDRKGRWPLGRTAFDESYGITAEQPRHFGYGFGRTLVDGVLAALFGLLVVALLHGERVGQVQGDVVQGQGR